MKSSPIRESSLDRLNAAKRIWQRRDLSPASRSEIIHLPSPSHQMLNVLDATPLRPSTSVVPIITNAERGVPEARRNKARSGAPGRLSANSTTPGGVAGNVHNLSGRNTSVAPSGASEVSSALSFRLRQRTFLAGISRCNTLPTLRLTLGQFLDSLLQFD